MRNIDNYVESARHHVPGRYDLAAAEISALNECGIYHSVVNAWLFRFETAYRAAMDGKLDFQQAKKKVLR